MTTSKDKVIAVGTTYTHDVEVSDDNLFRIIKDPMQSSSEWVKAKDLKVGWYIGH